MIRLLVVDDQLLVRQGIAALLQLEADFEVVGEAADGEDCLARLDSLRPDLLLLDIRMPKLNGLDTLAALRVAGHALPVILLTTFDEPMTRAQAERLGAAACLLKDIPHAELASVIRRVMAGQRIPAPRMDADALFTSREMTLIRELCAGRKNREIAEALALSEGTVRNYLSTLMEKLEARDRTQAILKLQSMGLGRA